MRLTRTQLFIFSLLVAGAGIVLYLLLHTTSSKDTPIVVAGGSIYGTTAKNDSDGWTMIQSQTLYSASTHQSSPGIDYLDFGQFDNPPNPNPVTGTKGWAISYSVPDGNGGVVPYALRYCSDPTCSASKVLMNGTKNGSICSGSGSFSASSPVYFGVNTSINSLQLDEQKTGKLLYRLEFDDTDSKCASNNGNKCNHIQDVSLEVCNGTVYPAFSCSKSNGKCSVQVGTP